MRNFPRLHITQLGIFYNNNFYKHECYDFFSFHQDSIYFYKIFPNNDKTIFTINNLDKEEMNELLQVLCQMSH